MIFQVLDVDYTLVNGKPVVRIFGKTKKGQTVCGFFEDHEPYLYVRGDNVAEAVEEEGNVKRIEKVNKHYPIGYQKDMLEFTRITMRNPAKTPELREKLKTKGFEVFEADIPFKYRFMADHDIEGMCWVEVNMQNGVNTDTVRTDNKIKINGLKKTDGAEIAPLRYLALDIECVSLKPGEMPDPSKDPMVMVSLAFSEPYKGARDMVLSTRGGKGITAYGGEKEMLEGLVEIINDYDPDIITGYNINNFDLPYILDRMREKRVYPSMGRCKNKMVIKRKLFNRFKINISGRIIVDSFELVRKDFSLKRYDLDTVGRELIGERKDPVKKSDIPKMWKGPQKDFENLAKYCLKDSLLAMDLLLRLNLLDKYIALANVSGTLLQDILDSGETSKIENLLLREFNKKGFVLPCRPDKSVVRNRMKQRKVGLTGGYVIEPEKGLHSNVIVLDFKSMYPSIIRTYNICPTTLLKAGDAGGTKTPSGARFVKDGVRKGIIPAILENLMDERQKVKKVLMKTRAPDKKRALSAKQFALKIMANAFYGHMGYPRAKVYSLDIANSITSFGRETIKKTKEYVESNFNYKVIYGDTDSLMVKVPAESLDDMKKIGDRIAEKVTSMLDGVMELEFEKVLKRFLPLTKKRYAAWTFENAGDGWSESILTKGIETVRRDWCDLTSESIQKVLEIILKKNDISEAVDFFKEVIGDLGSKKTDPSKLVITKTMTKRAGDYEGIQPHAELAKKMEKRSPAEAPGVGDRIGYVIVKGMGLLSKRTEDPSYVKEKGLEIDSRYYVENQLLPPLERIFGAMGISKSELLGKGKQIDLFGAFNGDNGKKPSGPKKIKASEMDGLVCRECGKKYYVPPISGVCDCGGSLLFSSPNGTASTLIL